MMACFKNDKLGENLTNVDDVLINYDDFLIKSEDSVTQYDYSKRFAQSAGPDVQICSSVSESPTNSLSGALFE